MGGVNWAFAVYAIKDEGAAFRVIELVCDTPVMGGGGLIRGWRAILVAGG